MGSQSWRSRRTRPARGRSSGPRRPRSRPRWSSATTTRAERSATRRWPTGSRRAEARGASAAGTCTSLADLGVELVTTGGSTHAYLLELGLEPTLVDVPQMLGGRVKTLHPRIHAGILARRERDDDVAALEQHEIEPIDIVCVNLYPFAS